MARTAGSAGRGKALGGALLAAFALGAPAATATATAAAGGPARSGDAAFAGSGGTAGGMQRKRPDLPDLVEAARRQRERVAESRERRGPAPRFTDADLPRTDRNQGDRNQGDRNQGDRNQGDRNRGDRNRGDRGGGTDRQERPGAGAGEDDPDPAAAGGRGESGGEAGTRPGEPAGARAAGTPDPGESRDPGEPGDTGADAVAAEAALSPEEREERAAELREKLLDLEAALAAIGVSGLPTAARHPNRFGSAFDAGRLRAEQREARRELAELESGTGPRRPR